MDHLSTLEAEAGGAWVRGQPELYSETLSPLVPHSKRKTCIVGP